MHGNGMSEYLIEEGSIRTIKRRVYIFTQQR